MSLFSITGLVLCVTFFAAGVIDSVCGGGGLITIPVLVLLGIPTRSIAGTNQCSVVLGSAVSVAKYAKARCIHLLTAVIAAATSVAGSFCGSKVNMFVPESVIRFFMLAMMPVIVAIMLFSRKNGSDDRSDTLTRGNICIRSALIGFVVGAYQGFYGPGAGMFYMLGFAVFDRLDYLKATGSARLAGFAASVAATVTYATSGLVIWQYAAAATAFNMFGNWLGAHLAVKKGAGIIRPVMLGVTALLFIRVLTDLLH